MRDYYPGSGIPGSRELENTYSISIEISTGIGIIFHNLEITAACTYTKRGKIIFPFVHDYISFQRTMFYCQNINKIKDIIHHIYILKSSDRHTEFAIILHPSHPTTT